MITTKTEPTEIRIGPLLYGSTKLGTIPGGGLAAGRFSSCIESLVLAISKGFLRYRKVVVKDRARVLEDQGG